MESDLNSLLDGAQQAQSQAISDQLDKLQPLIQWAMVLGTILSIIFVIAYIVNIIYKIRVERAILRIDKNVQKLVDVQVPVSAVTEKNSSVSEDIK